jgi:tetratricopeptide (TPR) repeat protein
MLSTRIKLYNNPMFRNIIQRIQNSGSCLKLLMLPLFLIFFGTGSVYCQSKKAGSGESANAKAGVTSKEGLSEARELLIAGKPLESLMIYSTLVSADSLNVALNCEYAYVLAINGNYDAALYRLDRIWHVKYLYPEPSYYASQVFLLTNNKTVASVITEVFPGGNDPKWISPVAAALLEKYKQENSLAGFQSDEVEEYFIRANRLTSRGSYLQAISLFNYIITTFPNEYLPYVGYSTALEKAGFTRMAVTVLENGIRLLEKVPGKDEDKAILEKRLANLRSKPSGPPKSYLGKALTSGSPVKKNPPRLMAYAGGMISPSYTNVNGRFGYFLSGSGNAALDLGVSSMSGSTSYNVGMTYYQRRKIFVAGFGLGGNFTGNTSAAFLKLSVGFSFQSKNKVSSWDIFWDGLAPFSKSQVTRLGFSAGRSMYFGKR